jgi:hypothetical protein
LAGGELTRAFEEGAMNTGDGEGLLGDRLQPIC